MRTIRLEESHYERMVKEQNDCRLALAAFMAAYGNCEIPGAVMNLAHKPEVPHGVSEHDAIEIALFKAWQKGFIALGLQYGHPDLKPDRKGGAG
jgi:hypothetical protein